MCKTSLLQEPEDEILISITDLSMIVFRLSKVLQLVLLVASIFGFLSISLKNLKCLELKSTELAVGVGETFIPPINLTRKRK